MHAQGVLVQAPLQAAGTGGGEDQPRWTGVVETGLAGGGRWPAIGEGPQKLRKPAADATDSGRIGVQARVAPGLPMFPMVADVNGLLPEAGALLVFAWRHESS